MNSTERLYLATVLEKQAMAASAGNAVGQAGGMLAGLGQRITKGYNNFVGGVQSGYNQGQNRVNGVKPLLAPKVAPMGTMQFGAQSATNAVPAMRR